ncbi:MAG: hypothetical protein [Bacteriophage sp.]|jgi:hypothetical protein|nr:MAG: hypothetical protein [Bacteriophage sp.]
MSHKESLNEEIISKIKKELHKDMDNSTKKTIEEIKNIIGKKQTLESVIFSEDDEEMDAQSLGGEIPTDMGQPEPQIPHTDKGMDDGNNDMSSIGELMPDIQNKVNTIRRMALEGVTKLADKPLSPEYDFFKKIFMDCDKLFVNKDKIKQ